MADDRPAPKPPPDPFAMWREWVTQSEHQMNKAFNEMMGTEQFARASGGWIEAMTMFQQTMNEGAQRYFQAMNLPTRTDVAELAERLAAVEERLLRIESLLAQAMGRKGDASPAPRPARTRRPPSRSKARDGAGVEADAKAAGASPAASGSTAAGEGKAAE